MFSSPILFRLFPSFSFHNLASLNLFHFQLCGLTIDSVLPNELWRWSARGGSFWAENIRKGKSRLPWKSLGMVYFLELVQSSRANKERQQQSKACGLRLAEWRDEKYLVPNYIIELLIHLNLKLASLRIFCYVGKKINFVA